MRIIEGSKGSAAAVVGGGGSGRGGGGLKYDDQLPVFQVLPSLHGSDTGDGGGEQATAGAASTAMARDDVAVDESAEVDGASAVLAQAETKCADEGADAHGESVEANGVQPRITSFFKK